MKNSNPPENQPDNNRENVSFKSVVKGTIKVLSKQYNFDCRSVILKYLIYQAMIPLLVAVFVVGIS